MLQNVMLKRKEAGIIHHSGIIYCYTYSNYKVTYYGKTYYFYTESLNTWRSPILQKNVSKMLNSLQYLTIYYIVIVP